VEGINILAADLVDKDAVKQLALEKPKNSNLFHTSHKNGLPIDILVINGQKMQF